MATTVAPVPLSVHEKLNRKPHSRGLLIFGLVLIAGLIFIGTSIARDLGDVRLGSAWPYVLLSTALFVALGFEFVNGFHDTANAVARVIYRPPGDHGAKSAAGLGVDASRSHDPVGLPVLWLPRTFPRLIRKPISGS